MKYIKQEWTHCLTFLKKNIYKPFLFIMFLFVLVSVVSWILLIYNPAILQSAYAWLEELFVSKDLANTITAFALFKNNAIACLYSIIMGIIPFFFVGMFSLALNAVAIGIMGALYSFMDISLLVFFAGLIPHGIFEFPAIFLSLAISFKFCLDFTLKLIGKKEDFNFSDWLINILRTYVFVIIPLLIMAAIIEAHITPFIMNIFMGA